MTGITHCYLCGRVVEEATHCKIINGLPKFLHNSCWELYKKGITPEAIEKSRRLLNDSVL